MRSLLFLFLFLLLSNTAMATQARSLPPDVLRARAVAAHNDRYLASTARFTQESFEFNSPAGIVLTAKLLVPTQEEKGTRFPVVSVFGGFERATKLLETLQPKAPIIVASFDYPFDAPKKFEFSKSLSYAPDTKRAISDMLGAIEELHNAIKKREDVDASKITVLGASIGAPFALTAAADDPTISGIVIIHGFGDIPGTVKHRLLRRWEPKFGALAHPMAWLFSHLGWLYLDGPAPEESVLRLTSRQRVYMIQAEEDSYIPTASSSRLWKAIENSAAQHERLMTPGDHLQPDSNRAIENISDQIINWMKRSELL